MQGYLPKDSLDRFWRHSMRLRRFATCASGSTSHARNGSNLSGGSPSYCSGLRKHFSIAEVFQYAPAW